MCEDLFKFLKHVSHNLVVLVKQKNVKDFSFFLFEKGKEEKKLLKVTFKRNKTIKKEQIIGIIYCRSVYKY